MLPVAGLSADGLFIAGLPVPGFPVLPVEELFDLRMKKATGTLDKPHRIHELRKDVARMKTILTEMDGSEN